MPGNSYGRHQKETEMVSLFSALCHINNPPLKGGREGRLPGAVLSFACTKNLTGLQRIHSKALYRVCE